jgi:endonuclease/exonuclease/phosphatase family metal-dependent hydrolase
MRLASFNVENLFERAVALNNQNWSVGKPALEAVTRLNRLLNHPTYSAADKAKIMELLRFLGLEKKDDGGDYGLLRQNRGKLVSRTKTGPVIVANGRTDWIGWVELKTEPVNELATRHTAMVVRDVDADVQAVVEAEDRPALLKFMSIVFKVVNAAPYGHVMLIDGNDDRGIDVALLAKADHEIVRIRSHVDDADTVGRIFSRDCPEYTIRTPSGERPVVLVNHFKSKGFGSNTGERRRRQAARVAEIYSGLIAEGDQHVAIVGDLNDTPDSAPLAPLVAATDLKDISTHPQFDDGAAGKRPGTFGTGTARNKIDYILLSPALFARVQGGGIFRKGAWAGEHGTIWEHYDTITRPAEAASDHSAIYADIQI